MFVDTILRDRSRERHPPPFEVQTLTDCFAPPLSSDGEPARATPAINRVGCLMVPSSLDAHNKLTPLESGKH